MNGAQLSSIVPAMRFRQRLGLGYPLIAKGRDEWGTAFSQARELLRGEVGSKFGLNPASVLRPLAKKTLF
jgi:hypothetical protein